MEQDIRLGRIAGIPVGVNWSVLFIVALVIWELSDLVLPAYVAGRPTAEYWIVGSVATVLFFASLLLHETSHAVVARREGVGVRRITLWLFGGVSELEGEALSPGADFRIAVVGPLTSFVLAGIFWLLTLALQPHQGSTVASAAAGWLGWTNLLLGGFNLLPGAPLDGGRVVRAALWRRRGDRASAAASAARGGIALGYGLMVLGVLEFIAGYLAGLWFVFLGLFLLQAARAEGGQEALRAAVASVTVREVMTPDPITFSPSMSVAELLDTQLHRYRFNTFPLATPEGELRGLATMRRVAPVPLEERPRTRLIDVACPMDAVPVAAPDDPVANLLARMGASPDGRGLVLLDGRLVGVVSPSDVARFVQLRLLREPAGASAGSRW